MGIDTYSGGIEMIEYPVNRDSHEHHAAEGGYYVHTHPGGRLDHSHDNKLCEWYVLCGNTASWDVTHPVLGTVPTCNRCVHKHNLEDRATRRPYAINP